MKRPPHSSVPNRGHSTPDKSPHDEIWDALELPPSSPVPKNYADRVVAHCRTRGAAERSFGVLAQAAAVAALVLGTTLGFWVGDPVMSASRSGTPAPSGSPVQVALPAAWAHAPSLSEIYWTSNGLDADELMESDLLPADPSIDTDLRDAVRPDTVHHNTEAEP